MLVTVDDIMSGPPYTPRHTWPKVEIDPCRAYKTRLHRVPTGWSMLSEQRAAERLQESTVARPSEGRPGEDMLRAVQAAT